MSIVYLSCKVRRDEYRKLRTKLLDELDGEDVVLGFDLSPSPVIFSHDTLAVCFAVSSRRAMCRVVNTIDQYFTQVRDGGCWTMRTQHSSETSVGSAGVLIAAVNLFEDREQAMRIAMTGSV